MCLQNVPAITRISLFVSARCHLHMFHYATHTVYQPHRFYHPHPVHAGIGWAPSWPRDIDREGACLEALHHIPTWVGSLWVVVILFVVKTFAHTGRFAASSCSRAVAATLHVLHWHYSEVCGHLGSSVVRNKVRRGVQWWQLGRRSLLNFHPHRKEKKPSKGSQVEDIGPHCGEPGFRWTTTLAPTVVFPFSLYCDPVSSKLRVKVLPPAREAGQSPAMRVFTLSLLVPFPPFYPHCSKTIAPCDPLFTIWKELESIHGEPCSSSHCSDHPTFLTHTFVLPKGRETNSKAPIKVSQVSLQSALAKTKQLALIYWVQSEYKLCLFFWLWFCFLVSLQAGSFCLWFPPGKQNGCYLSHSALWVAVKCRCSAESDTTCSHAHTHCASKGNTLRALNTNFPLYSPQGKRTELTTMGTSKRELFSVCENDFTDAVLHCFPQLLEHLS